ncbi:hypothetical protein IAR55_006708 [Kwoniella newhampshirensis]|uniref:N-acetyltransferase domain-containing protein n=1 Tax=Kwoniella newhampshirensis TaxID=1651941 RepID=A0AAW0YSM7_9TREE
MQWDQDLDEPYIPVRDGVRLTPFHAGDTDALYAVRSDPAVLAASEIDASQYTLVKAREYLDRMIKSRARVIDLMRRGEQNDQSPFDVIRSYPSGELLGCIQLHLVEENNGTGSSDQSGVMESNRSRREYEVGFSVSSAARGTGLAQAALSALIEVMIVKVLKGAAVIADVKDDNMASRRTLEKCGLRMVKAFNPEDNPPPFENYRGSILLYRRDLAISSADVATPAPRSGQ